MKIKCISTCCLEDKQNTIEQKNNESTWLTVDKVYTVLGLTIMTTHESSQKIFFEICSDTGMIHTAPYSLFEIIDDRPSKFWGAQVRCDSFTLWPKEFYIDFFHDLLTDREPEYVEIFNSVVRLMEREFDEDFFIRNMQQNSYPENEWWKNSKTWK